jgi:hypothetical protein
LENLEAEVLLMKRLMTVAAVVFGVAMLLPPALIAAEPDEMISSAQSAADHEAIAGYYERQETEAKAKAEQHRKMAMAYKSVSKKGGSVVVKHAPAQHCEKLAKRYDSDAEAYKALADAHREAAKGAE